MDRREARSVVRLLHTSDIHLGWDSIRAMAERSLSAVVEVANQSNVDLALIAGDLFDYNAVTQEIVECAVSELRRLKMPVILLPGNHDVYDDNSIYKQVDLESACRNLKLITDHEGEVVSLAKHDIAIWGKAMTEHHPGFSPLQGNFMQNGYGWRVGMAHGHYCADNRNIANRSSPILAREIAAAPFDYVALGHWHVYLDVSQDNVKALYSGSPAGSGFKPTLGEVAIVTLDPGRGVLVEQRSLEPGTTPPEVEPDAYE